MKSYAQKRTKPSRKNLIILSLLALLLVGGGVYAYVRNDRQNNAEAPGEEIVDETINFTPPTDDEKQETEDNKQRIVEQQEQEQNNPGSGSARAVTVTVTSADSSSVFARVSGVVEDGGACTAVFTKGASSLSKSSEGVANVSDTQCSRIAPPTLASGNWQVVVSYKSNSAEGTSEPFAFTVP